MARDKGGAYVLEANAALARAAAFRHQPSSTRGWRVGPDQAWTPPVQADLPTLRKSQRERRPSYKARMAELYAEADEPSPKGTSTKRRKVERTGPHLGAPPGAAERLQPRPPIAKVPGSRVKARQPTADPGDRPINSVVQPIHVPVIRFPGEAPLHVETLLGEQDAHHSDAVPCATPETAYRRAVDAARARMVARAKRIGVERGMPELPGRSLAACETFERLCLEGGSSTASAIEREAACTEYDAVLREVYGGLMLDPHVLSVEALEAEEDTGAP